MHSDEAEATRGTDQRIRALCAVCDEPIRRRRSMSYPHGPIGPWEHAYRHRVRDRAHKARPK